MQNFADILEYIPQRAPFVMVDKLTAVSDEYTVSGFEIKSDNLFCSDGYFYEGGLIENIAQTLAAGAGFRIRENGEEPALGMIGAVKRLTISRRPGVGEILKTEVKLITQFENALVIEGSVFCKDQLIANCQMNIFVFRNSKDMQL
jgi:predicted hotdog family 3-hydroxylacyl-ACP dehydratase